MISLLASEAGVAAQRPDRFVNNIHCIMLALWSHVYTYKLLTRRQHSQSGLAMHQLHPPPGCFPFCEYLIKPRVHRPDHTCALDIFCPSSKLRYCMYIQLKQPVNTYSFLSWRHLSFMKCRPDCGVGGSMKFLILFVLLSSPKRGCLDLLAFFALSA